MLIQVCVCVSMCIYSRVLRLIFFFWQWAIMVLLERVLVRDNTRALMYTFLFFFLGSYDSAL